MTRKLKLVFLGLSLSSSWGNGHATTYRGLLRALRARGHDALFLERERPWYSENRDLRKPEYCRLEFYSDPTSLRKFHPEIAAADAVILGSYVPDGISIARFVLSAATGVTAFYDIDTPVTLAKLASGDFEYISPPLIRRFDLYLSFSEGAALEILETHYGARAARPLLCSVDPDAYRPSTEKPVYDLGYLGTYSEDRQAGLERLLMQPALRLSKLRFVVAGPLYPASIDWPANVEHVAHVPPAEHARFYGSCRFTLNLTRSDMVRLGHSPSVRLFEAAAVGTPIISDVWKGIEEFLEPGREIALARYTDDVISVLTGWTERRRRDLGSAARGRILAEHTSTHRAKELEKLLLWAADDKRGSSRASEPAVAAL